MYVTSINTRDGRYQKSMLRYIMRVIITIIDNITISFRLTVTVLQAPKQDENKFINVSKIKCMSSKLYDNHGIDDIIIFLVLQYQNFSISIIVTHIIIVSRPNYVAPLNSQFVTMFYHFDIIKCDWICKNRPNSHNSRNPVYCLTLWLHSPTVQTHQL